MSPKLHEFLVTLYRRDENSPWGIRLVGGSDLNAPLIITKVRTRYIFIQCTDSRKMHFLTHVQWWLIQNFKFNSMMMKQDNENKSKWKIFWGTMTGSQWFTFSNALHWLLLPKFRREIWFAQHFNSTFVHLHRISMMVWLGTANFDR